MSKLSKTVEKQIFVLVGPHNSGKTSTLMEVFNVLNDKYPKGKRNIILPRKLLTETNVKIDIKIEKSYDIRDIRITIEIGENLIGIESCGDPSGYDCLRVALKKYFSPNCNIIFCAARPNDKKINKLINSYSKNITPIEKAIEHNKQLHSKSNLEMAEYLIKAAGL